MSWAQSEPLDRSTNQTARALAIWQLQEKGLLDLSYGNKNDLAEKLGISRWTLDRALAVLTQAKQLAKELELALISEKRYEEMKAEPAQCISEEEYNRLLQAEGLPA